MKMQQKGDRSRSRRNRSHQLEALEGRRLMAAQIVGNPNTYATIQAAVDAALAGATVTVDAGTYAEQVYVGKSLTIRGAQAGVDARSNVRLAGALESIMTGAPNGSGQQTSSFYVAADNVTIDGFVVQGQTTQGDAGAGLVIAPNRSGTHVFNSIFQNNVAGIFLANASATNLAVIQNNLFRNNNNAGANGGRGIYTNGAISGGNLTNVLIDSNTFLGNRGSSGTTQLEAAIAFESASAGSQSKITITNNAMDNNGKAVLFFNTDNITITGNYITNTLDQYSGTLRFEGNNHNATIKFNTLYDNTGPAVAVDSKGMPGDNSGFVVTNNNFFRNNIGWTTGTNMSVAFDGSVYSGVPDVRNNWWGSSTGPGGDGPGTGDKVYGIGHVVPGQAWSVTTGGVELFSPWATAPVGVNRSAYFGLPSSDGANIQFEDYDHGGAGVAYNDTTASNSGGKYRNREQVDIETTTDTGGGFDVYNAVAGEWLSYAINLAQGGVFNLDIRLATAQTTGGKFHVEVDGVNVTGSLTVTPTGGNQTWKTLTATGLNLTAGTHQLKFVFDTNGNSGTIGSFNYFKLINTAPVAVPLAPTGLAALAASSTVVSLTWLDNATTETGYIVERRTPAGSWASIATLGTNATAYVDSTALSSQTYNYRVKALGTAGDSAYSSIASVTTPASQAVTYLSDLPFVGTPLNGWGPIERDQTVGGQGTDDGQTLTLNGVTYAKGLGTNSVSDVSFTLAGAYKQFLADVGLDDKQQYDGTVVFQVFADGVKIYDSGIMTPTTATQHLNLDITGVQTLRLRVDDGGDGTDFDQADWADARVTLNSAPPPVQTPAAPTGLAASAASSTLVNLTWSAVTGATSYRIERALGAGSFTQIGSSTTASYADATVAASTAYTYRVRAANSAGDSSYSTTSGVTTPATPVTPTIPAAPSGLAASAASSTQVNLTWSASSGATSYKIERSLDGVTFAQLGTSTTATYNDSTVTASKTFTYRVRATNAVGDSTYSNIASATTPAAPTVPAAPSGLVASPASSTQANLTWTAVAGATSYKIERATGSGAFAQIGTSATATFSDTTVVASTAYNYRVRATNSVGDSTYSSVAAVTTPVAPVVGWTNSAIGVMGPSPVMAVNNGAYTLQGAGSGITGTSDSFQFVYQQLTGDGTIIARVTGVQNTANSAQAGIMMRDGLVASAKEVSLIEYASATRGVRFLRRTSVGGTTAATPNSLAAVPVWLKLVRKGSVITAYRSANGTTWTTVGSQTVSMNSTIYVGLVVASRSTTTVNTSTFDNVSVTKG